MVDIFQLGGSHLNRNRSVSAPRYGERTVY
jgi:hypothetical protein